MNKRKEVFHGISQHHSGMSSHTLLGLGVETGTNHLDTCLNISMLKMRLHHVPAILFLVITPRKT